MTGGHLETGVLAEYDERLLSADQTAAVEAHLATCEACSSTVARLGAVSERLRSAPERLAVPAGVVSRIDEALAAEHRNARRSPVERLRVVRPLLRRAPQLLGAAALVGVVAFTGYVVVDGWSDQDDQGAAGEAETAADAPDERDLAEPETGGDDADMAIPEARAEIDGDHLAAQIRAIAAGRAGFLVEGDGAAAVACGQSLARELGRDLLGAAPIDVAGVNRVLVVVAVKTDDAQGWILPNCDASTTEALAERTIRLD
jgi:anti-sigma factor RsiW